MRFNNLGTNAAATLGLGNGTGIRISAGAARNVIGGPVTTGFDNAIFVSQGNGLLIEAANGTLFQSNFLQLSGDNGIEVRSSRDTTIGGVPAAGRTLNFIWTSSSDGVEISGAASTNTLVQAKIGRAHV